MGSHRSQYDMVLTLTCDPSTVLFWYFWPLCCLMSLSFLELNGYTSVSFEYFKDTQKVICPYFSIVS